MPPNTPLTENTLRALKPAEKPYRRFVGDGLYVEVATSGARLWRLKYRFGGQEKRLALGAYPAVTMRMAKERAGAARDLVYKGVDPAEKRRTEKAEARRRVENTVAAAAESWLAAKRPEWAASTYAKSRVRVDQFIVPPLGRRPLDSVTTKDLVDLIKGVSALGLKDTPTRVARDLTSIFGHAVHQGLIQGTPALTLSKAAPRVQKRHFAAPVEPADFAHVVRLIGQHRGGIVVHSLLQLMLYLPTRPGELRTMLWSDLNLTQGMLSLPAERMKSRRPFLMPIPTQAIMILQNLRQYTGDGTNVFPGHRDRTRPLSDAACGAALRALGIDTQTQFTPHGIRASFRTICRERLGADPDVLEAHLAHQPAGALKGAYDRAKHLDERRRVGQAWADYVDAQRTGADVLPFKGRAA